MRLEPAREAAAACSNKDDCMGFNFKSDKPDCLYVPGRSALSGPLNPIGYKATLRCCE